MGKALTGAIELGAAAGLVAGAFFTGGADLALVFAESSKLFAALAIGGVASEAGAIADALAQNRGQNITTRQPAGFRQIIYGEQRVGGTLVYQNTTGGHHDQNNNVIVLAGHTIDGIVALYLDGRQVHYQDGPGTTTCPGGYRFGGAANGTKYYDAANVSYNFGGLVYTVGYYGNQTAATAPDGSLHANDPTWARSKDGVPYGGGCAWAYLKYEYDTKEFPQQPESRWTIRGKNTIWDPRTNATGYTANWALCVADFLCDPDFGFGFPRAEIDTIQLIAAANLCDERVALQNGGTEPRYTYNGHWDTSKAPGDALQEMLTAASGSIVYRDGSWFIYPAGAFTPSFSWGMGDLLEPVQWQPYRSQRDLINRVRGTFTAPNYPYAPTGNLYNTNGLDPDSYRQGNFNYGWQPTSYPEYAQDTLHGYPTDFFLAQDQGVEMVGQLNLGSVISVATAQRLAKLKLMLNRRQGTATFALGLQAWRMAPMDVFTLDYAPYGWTGKQFQVTSIALAVDVAGDGPPRLYCQVEAREFDANDYAWSAAEELSILDQPNYALQHEADVQPPGSLTLTSGQGFDVLNADGVLLPRVLAQWTDPLDVLVTQVEIQVIYAGASTWRTAGTFPVGAQQTFLTGFAANDVISVQIRSLRASGAFSAFLTIPKYTVSATSVSTITSIGLLPGIPFNLANDATIDSIPYPGRTDVVYLRVYGPGGPGSHIDIYTGYGPGPVAFAATQVTAAPGTPYYVVLANLAEPLAQSRGYSFGSYVLQRNYSDTISDTTILIGTCTTCAADGSGGTTGGGGSGANGGGGSRGTACTVEHTELDTPDGPVNNVLLKHRFDLGLPVYLSTPEGRERIVRARWVWVPRHQRLRVGAAEIGCSDTHTVGITGEHVHCAKVASGTLIDTRDGARAMERTPIFKTVKVLELELEGPTHIYSASGVWTHNTYKVNNN